LFPLHHSTTTTTFISSTTMLVNSINTAHRIVAAAWATNGACPYMLLSHLMGP
jgi:hypothetical protein